MKRRVAYPDDPAWFANRTAAEAAALLGCSASLVHAYCRYHRIRLQPDQRFSKYMHPAEWYAQRTVPQIARALNVPYDYAEKYIRRHRIEVKRRPAVAVRVSNEPVPLYGRDDVRYTDEVIATLRSNLHRTDIAERLRIPVADVVFHYQETQGIRIAANTAVLPAVVVDFEKKHKRNRNTECAFFPSDREWYSTRTVHGIARELGTQLRVVQRYIARHGIAVVPSVAYESVLAMIAATLPTDAAWYRQHSVSEIAMQYGLNEHDIRQWVRMRGFRTRHAPAPVLRHTMPDDAAWYAQRTLQQIAAATGASERYARLWCTAWGYSYIRQYRKGLRKGAK